MTSKAPAWRSIGAFALDASLILIFVLLFSLPNGFWDGYPHGWDTPNHLTIARYYHTYGWSTDWNYQWGSGFPRSIMYPPLPYYLVLAIQKATGLSLEMALQIGFLWAFFAMAFGVYGSVRQVTSSRLAALCASLLLLGSTCLWGWAIAEGYLTRLAGAAGVALTTWSVTAYAKNPIGSKTWLPASLALALALLSHYLSGLIALLTALFIVVLSVPGLRSKMRSLAMLFGSAALLSAPQYVPLLMLAHPGSSFLSTTHKGLWTISEVLSYLGFGPDRWHLFPFWWVLVVIVCILIFLQLRRRQLRPAHSELSLACAVTLMLALFTIYVFGVYLRLPPQMYMDGFPHHQGVFFLNLFGMSLMGIALGVLARSSETAGTMALMITLGLLLLVGILQFPLDGYSPSFAQSDTNAYTASDLVQEALRGNETQRAYRFASDDESQAKSMNYVYEVPQTNIYFYQGSLIPDWQAWLVGNIWVEPGKNPAAEFLMDWFAVKWLYVGYPNYNYPKYLDQPATYKLQAVDPNNQAYVFTYNDATPILAALRSPVLFHIGQPAGYTDAFRALSHSNFNSQHIITVRGPNYLDDLTLDELSQFDLVILYGFDYRDQGKAFNLLADYVREGGGLIVEVNGSPLDNASSIPEPIPVSRTEATNYGTEWNFISADHEILEGIDLSAFGPAIYDQGPWGVSSTEETDIRHWAQPILFTNGHPIVVAGQYGQGRVVWTGMNLLYHIASYQSEEESRFLAQMIQWVSNEDEVAQPQYEARFVHPQRREVTVQSPAKGLLFKESYFPNWRAYVAGRERRIYRAGPDFMYVPLSEEISYPLEAILLYEKSWLERISIGISLLTLGGLIFYALEGWVVPPLPHRFRRLLLQWPAMALKAARDWWADEE